MSIITLSGSRKYVTQTEKQRILVAAGSAVLCLQPVRGETYLRQLFVGSAKEGETIPAVARTILCDAAGGLTAVDKTQPLPDTAVPVTWYLVIGTGSACTLEITDLPEVPADADERVAAYIETYLAGLREDEEKIRRTKERSRRAKERTGRIILDLLQPGAAEREENEREERERKAGKEEKEKEGEKEREQEDTGKGEDPEGSGHSRKTGRALYETVRALCLKEGIPIVEENTLLASCGRSYSVEDIARMSGFVTGKVTLEAHWEKNLVTPLLVFGKDGKKPQGVFPDRWGRARVLAPGGGRGKLLTGERAAAVNPEAVAVYRPLPPGKVTFRSILSFVLKEPLLPDILILLVSMLLGTLAQTGLATLNTAIYDRVIPQGTAAMLYGTGTLFLALMAANIFYQVCRTLTGYRITSRIRYNLQAAIYARAFHLPENYYKRRESAETAYRLSSLAQTYVFVLTGLVQVVLQVLFSAFYYNQMAGYSRALTGTAMLFVLLLVVLTLIPALVSRRFQQRRSRLTGKMRSFLYQVFSGISTIRVYGAEDEALSVYAGKLSEYARADYENAAMMRTSQLLTLVVSGAASIVMYYRMGSERLGISMGVFMGFITAYTLFAGAIAQAATQAMNIIMMIPMLRDSVELLRIPEERSDAGIILQKPRGDIRIEGVTFRYRKDQAPILNRVSLHIRPGEYVAIVGETGCGKSTLLRLLLGFEQPQEGEVFYDGISTQRLNMPELRRRIGVVLQDGGLFSGSIYRNLKAANPAATDAQIRQAIEDAGLTEEIEAMPLGIHTIVSEEAQTISGGQKQRIMIARAIVGSPGIVFLDEATSSLDNLSQAKVCESLAAKQMTRVVIAHRLSTVKTCSRIVVLDHGGIAESGTFEELMERKGKFYQLAQKQLV